ncbi:DUF3558 domain-containing protein [Saccharopolyspora rectivirgula]|uniref:DUF3558 domain-containing protein n=1 Tax=Saccharopolyspora rectivirgula TaxID=28042 RepID=UPI001362A057|nr:DUF3558 domain-containing protein [Saccharopolyspora rectivirgula]
MAGLAVAGCAGEPASGGEQPPVERTTPEVGRPGELSLAGKSEQQLCELLTPQQQDQLGVHTSTGADAGDPDFDIDYPNCGFLYNSGSEVRFGVTVAAVPKSLADFKDELGEPFPETAASYDISGFPAEQMQPGAGLEGLGCHVLVDVAEGETLDVFLGNMNGSEGMTNEQMCSMAKQSAQAVVATLQAQG